MKTRNLTRFPFGTKVTSRRGKQPEMTLVLRATYVLAPGPLAPPDGGRFIAQGSMSCDAYREGDDERAGECIYPGDFADWKPSGEVMLRGTCHAPGGKAVSECPVHFEVGPWSKTLRVVGRRMWSDDLAGAVMSDAAPFTAMPIGYANAYGGPGYAANPAGKGFAGRELPNVEHPGRPIRNRRDDHGPAGFGPLNPAWPERAAKIGKEYGPQWKKERAPYHAVDLDWSYFNCAPRDQRLEGYLRGDEALRFQNLHPTHAVLDTRLPAIRIRAFVNDEKGRFREVAMSLDTLFADVDDERLYLTWRGLDAIDTDDMKDVKTVLVASEPLAEPRLPEAHYRAQLGEFEADPQGVMLRDRLPEEKRAELDEMKKQLAEYEAKQKSPPAKPERPPAPDPLTAKFAAMFDALPAQPKDADAKLKQIADAVAKVIAKAPPEANMEAKIAEMAASMKTPALAKPSPPPIYLRPGAPPPAWAAKAVQRSFDNVDEAKKRAADIKLPPGEAGEKAAAQRQELGEKLDGLKGQPFFKDILARRPPPREPAPYADLSGQDYEERDLRGADLRGANLCDANLAGANLAGAKLAGACLDGAVLVGADLTGADLTGADLTYCNLSGVIAKQAVFREAKLDQAWLKDADLTGACLARATGKRTMLPGCNLEGADCKGLALEDAFARKANLGGADLTGAVLVRSYFLDARARKANLTRATLEATSFAGADLTQATLVEAKGDRSMWLRAKLQEANFTHAALPNAMLLDATGLRAVFRRAILRDARCYRGSFEQADFTEANLVRVDFSKCALSGARFTGANLYDAKLRQAAGKDCDFTRANLARALVEEA